MGQNSRPKSRAKIKGQSQARLDTDGEPADADGEILDLRSIVGRVPRLRGIES